MACLRWLVLGSAIFSLAASAPSAALGPTFLSPLGSPFPVGGTNPLQLAVGDFVSLPGAPGRADNARRFNGSMQRSPLVCQPASGS